MDDIYIYSDENLLEQLRRGNYEMGFYRVKFYSESGRPAEYKTGELSEYFLYPSGGTLRDKDMNIIGYNSRFDTYRGFIPPHRQKKD